MDWQALHPTSATERWSAFFSGKSNGNNNHGNDFISFNGILVPQGRLTNITNPHVYEQADKRPRGKTGHTVHYLTWIVIFTQQHKKHLVIELGQARLLRRHIAPFLDNRLLDLPWVGS